MGSVRSIRSLLRRRSTKEKIEQRVENEKDTTYSSLKMNGTHPSEPTTLKKVHSALAGLSVLEFEVITALFPECGAPEPYEVIANKFGLTVEEVMELEANSLRDLRGTSRGLRRIGAPWN